MDLQTQWNTTLICLILLQHSIVIGSYISCTLRNSSHKTGYVLLISEFDHIYSVLRVMKYIMHTQENAVYPSLQLTLHRNLYLMKIGRGEGSEGIGGRGEGRE